jgi:hypothetical protein
MYLEGSERLHTDEQLGLFAGMRDDLVTSIQPGSTAVRTTIDRVRDPANQHLVQFQASTPEAP